MPVITWWTACTKSRFCSFGSALLTALSMNSLTWNTSSEFAPLSQLRRPERGVSRAPAGRIRSPACNARFRHSEHGLVVAQGAIH